MDAVPISEFQQRVETECEALGPEAVREQIRTGVRSEPKKLRYSENWLARKDQEAEAEREARNASHAALALSASARAASAAERQASSSERALPIANRANSIAQKANAIAIVSLIISIVNIVGLMWLTLHPR